MLVWASGSLSPIPVRTLPGSNSTAQLWLHPQETQSWPRAVHPGSRRAEINKTSPNLQSLTFNRGRKVTCWESSSLSCRSLPDMKGLLLKDTYVDAEEWKTREVKLIYCFNLLHCRLNKLKGSCFPSEAPSARGRQRRPVPPTWLKGKVSQWWSAGKGDSGKVEAWDELVVVAHTGTSGEWEKDSTSLYFIFCISWKISPTLSAATAEGLAVYPVPRWDLAWFFGGKEEVLSSFVIEWRQVAP